MARKNPSLEPLSANSPKPNVVIGILGPMLDANVSARRLENERGGTGRPSICT